MRSPGNLTLLLALACVSMLVLRLGGAHLHLCLDGEEPPMSLHLGDSGVHHIDEGHGEAAADTPHSDQDVGVASDALIKKQGDFGGLVLLFVALLLFLLARPRSILPQLLTLPRFAHAPVRLRPPLRGPPR